MSVDQIKSKSIKFCTLVMNKQYTARIRNRYQKRSSLNVLSRIKWLSQPEQVIMTMHINKSLDFLKEEIYMKQVVKTFGIPTLFIREIKSTQVYVHLLANLSKIFAQVVHVVFYECQFTDKLLSAIDPEFWSGKCLTILQSKADNIISGINHRNVLSKLQYIVIGCDPIGNKGVKKLMGIEMNSLQKFLLINTQCTTDSIKLLKKKERPQYWHHEVLYQQKFNHILFYKQLMHFRGEKDNKIFTVQIKSFEAKTKSIYFGHLSKLYIKQPKLSINIQIKRNLQIFMEQQLIPQRTRKNMEQLIIWK